MPDPTSGTKATAVLDGNQWVLNGSETPITHATVGDAAVVIRAGIRAATITGSPRSSCPSKPARVAPGKKEKKLGMASSDTSSLMLEDCRIPTGYLLGEEGQGFVQAMKVLDGGRISIAALSVGIGRGALEATIEYAQVREQFGKPISSFQLTQAKLADVAAKADAARLLTWRSAALKDQGKNVTRESSMAKLFAPEAAVRIGEEAVQIHGGYGSTKDYPVERFWRDSKLCTIGEGTRGSRGWSSRARC